MCARAQSKILAYVCECAQTAGLPDETINQTFIDLRPRVSVIARETATQFTASPILNNSSSAPESVSAADQEKKMIATKRPHILYVEDNDDSCQMMTIILERSGIDVTCVRGMTDVLALPNKDRFDLFLLDLWLHDGDGNTLCKRLRAKYPNIPVVFYTGSATEREQNECISSGAAAYLVKPYSELIAPMIFKLVTGAGPEELLDTPAGPFTILEKQAKHLGKIMRDTHGRAPLSNYN